MLEDEHREDPIIYQENSQDERFKAFTAISVPDSQEEVRDMISVAFIAQTSFSTPLPYCS